MNPIKSELHGAIDPTRIKCSKKIVFSRRESVIKNARQKICLRGFCGCLYMVSLFKLLAEMYEILHVINKIFI